jgi:hypothetical protein
MQYMVHLAAEHREKGPGTSLSISAHTIVGGALTWSSAVRAQSTRETIFVIGIL